MSGMESNAKDISNSGGGILEMRVVSGGVSSARGALFHQGGNCEQVDEDGSADQWFEPCATFGEATFHFASVEQD